MKADHIASNNGMIVNTKYLKNVRKITVVQVIFPAFLPHYEKL
jgi:hypothetical protein